MASASINLDDFLERGTSVTDAVLRDARIAASFLPKKILSSTAKSVSVDKISASGFDDVTTIPLAEIRVRLTLDWQQLLAENFETSLYRVKKTAQSYCTIEDRLLFLGQSDLGGASLQLPFSPVLSSRVGSTLGGEVERGRLNKGLIDEAEMTTFYRGLKDIFAGISSAKAELEYQGTVGPWAVAMSAELFDRAEQTPTGFLESPRQRIENLFGCKVNRMPIFPENLAFIMGGAIDCASGLSGARMPAGPADRAVAVEPELRYLDRTNDQGRYQFAIVGCMALRIRDRTGLCRIQFM